MEPRTRTDGRRAARAATALIVAGAGALAQEGASAMDPETTALLERVDAARGRPAKPLDTLELEGTFTVAMKGQMDDQPFANGTFRDCFAADGRWRQVSTMPGLRDLERGAAGPLTWAVEPNWGAQLYDAADAAQMRRAAELQRGVGPGAGARAVKLAGREALDGRDHVIVETQRDTGPEKWWIDAQSARVRRIDFELPSPQDCVVMFGFPPRAPASLLLGDWIEVDGVWLARERTLQIGQLVMASRCTRLTVGEPIAAERLEPPEEVRQLAKAAVTAKGAEYEILERAVQPVASIRTQCRPDEISATLATLFPEVIGHVMSTGGKMAGPPFMRHHGFVGELIDLEAGIAVVKPVAEAGRVKSCELPGGRILMAWHFGPYEKLTGAHQKLAAVAAARQLVARGGPWEVYWTDPGMVPDPAKWRTQLFLPVE